MCRGWRPGGGAYARWHITSTDISAESFPLLKKASSGAFAHAVSFHGFDRLAFPGDDVRIGGLADGELKASVRDAIGRELGRSGKPGKVGVVQPGEVFSGMDPDNVVNRLAPTRAACRSSSREDPAATRPWRSPTRSRASTGRCSASPAEDSAGPRSPRPRGFGAAA